MGAMNNTLPPLHPLGDFIPHILLFFGIAGLVVPLLQRLKISPVLGYLICGAVIGPYGLAVFTGAVPWLSYITISDRHTVEVLGELGLIALMFTIGLDLSLERLWELRRYIFGLGGLQIVLTAAVIFALARLFGSTVQAAILIGASLALSSTSIIRKLLEEQKLADGPVGILCLSVLLMQDLAVVPILLLASSFSDSQGGGNVMLAIASSLALGTVAIIGIYLLGRKILTPALRTLSFSTTPEGLPAVVVFVVVGCAALTDSLGISLALGALMAGLLMAETPFHREVNVIIRPLEGMLLGIFFLSVGMRIDVSEVLRQPAALLLAMVGLYAVKAVIFMPLCLAFGVPGRKSAEMAIYLSQPGGFALVILGVALAAGLMPERDVQFFTLVLVLGMIFTPLLFKLAPLAGNWGHRRFPREG